MRARRLVHGWPLLAAASLLLIGGAYRSVVAGYTDIALVLATAGLITLGAWLATEIIAGRPGQPPDDDDGT